MSEHSLDCSILPTQKQERMMVETVSQVDREAAAAVLGGAAPDGLLDGRQDSLSLVQAFACHRAASEAHTLHVAEAVRDAAAEACREQQRDFLSPEYATGQPLSSFNERFACGECSKAIRALDIGRIVEGVGRG